MSRFVAALDQGTTSTRFMVFDFDGSEIARSQMEHRQILPRAGWVEHDPLEIMDRAYTVIDAAMSKGGILRTDLAAIGITNQRETVVVWNRETGQPYCNAIVWQDTRTDRIVSDLERSGKGDLIREKTGLPPSTYFSATKIQWILDNVAGVRAAAEKGEAIFGNVDTWLIWNLTGGPDGGVHITDVTNASRTMLVDLQSLEWDEDLLRIFGIPRNMLPEIHPSSDSSYYGLVRKPECARDVPICGDLGDQQAAMLGQVCVSPGEVKNTYGTGNFLLLNTGTQVTRSQHGLLSTAGYKVGSDAPVYALEGSIAVTGSAVQWLRDQLGIIQSAEEIETLARQVDDSGGLYFVPAFSGLFAPYWRTDARGIIAGISRFHTKAHLARATLEAICYQTRDVLDAMVQDSGIEIRTLKVDGGATSNEILMQLQADILGISVVRPVVAETTSLGAAYAAGLAAGFWKSIEELQGHWKMDRQWEPRWSEEQRQEGYAGWKKAVQRTLDWIE